MVGHQVLDLKIMVRVHEEQPRATKGVRTALMDAALAIGINSVTLGMVLNCPTLY